jgi:hypothetical protein
MLHQVLLFGGSHEGVPTAALDRLQLVGGDGAAGASAVAAGVGMAATLQVGQPLVNASRPVAPALTTALRFPTGRPTAGARRATGTALTTQRRPPRPLRHGGVWRVWWTLWSSGTR